MRHCLLVVFLLFGCAASGGQAEAVTKETVDGWMTELSNWGRWGDDDQMGTVNLITPETRKAAAKLVIEGVSVSLSRVTDTEASVDNPRPFKREMVRPGNNLVNGFTVDRYTVLYHGYAHSHMDSLWHMAYQGKMYNGFPVAGVTENGAEKLAITAFQEGIFARGVLVDIPLLKGADYLERGTAILPSDLDAWEQKAGIKIGTGDVVLIRTGRWKLREKIGPFDAAASRAGLHASCAKWFHERDIAVIGSDAGLDVFPSGVDGVRSPLHQLFLIAMGTPLLDNLSLEAVAEEAARQNRWEFLLTANPLAVAGGTGSR